METITIQIIDEILVYLEADIIMSNDPAQGQDNFVQIGRIISSDTDHLLETITTVPLVTTVPIIEVIIVDIVRIEVNHLVPHNCRTDTTLCEGAMRIELPQRVVIESRCHGAQLLFTLMSRA